jgi:hypothetical protein
MENNPTVTLKENILKLLEQYKKETGIVVETIDIYHIDYPSMGDSEVYSASTVRLQTKEIHH